MAVACAALPYLFPPVYRVDATRPFAGTELFNPYARIAGDWKQANFHAHGRAWGGVPDGHQSDAEVVRAYQARGYPVIGLSNHQRIAAGPGQIPIYEHGFNRGKRHQIVIGARSVDWFDVPLWQGHDQKQYVLERLKQSAALVVLAHPAEREAYSALDLESLSGYDLIEVVNGPMRMDALWDVALSSGHPVWALANDDTHDINDRDHTAVAWNMVDASTATAADVIPALRAGRTYAVSGDPAEGGVPEATLSRVEVAGDRLVVTCSGQPTDYMFVGQGGRLLKTAPAGPAASYQITPDDTYVRVEIGTAHTRMYLNPIVRYERNRPEMPAVQIDTPATWEHRLALIAVFALVVYVIMSAGLPHYRPDEMFAGGPVAIREPSRQ